MREEDIALRSDGRQLLAGMFGVPHKEAVDRLIFDRRPQNAEELRIAWARLPNGVQFCRLLLDEDEEEVLTLHGAGGGEAQSSSSIVESCFLRNGTLNEPETSL